MWSRLCSPGSWSLPVLAVCAACCCKALLPLWNLSVDREHLGPGRASNLLGPRMYTQGGVSWWGSEEGGRSKASSRLCSIFVHRWGFLEKAQVCAVHKCVTPARTDELHGTFTKTYLHV